MNVKEKGAVNIIAAHLPEVCLIPAANDQPKISDVISFAWLETVRLYFFLKTFSPHVRRLGELVEARAHGQKQHRQDRIDRAGITARRTPPFTGEMRRCSVKAGLTVGVGRHHRWHRSALRVRPLRARACSPIP